MISYKYKITNKQGKILFLNDHITDPSNVYALQKYPAFSKAIKNNELDRVGQNNYWDFYSYYGKQTLGLTGLIVADSHQKLEQMKQDLIQVFALPLQPNDTNDGYVTLSWTDDDGIDKEVEAKLISDIIFDRPLQRRYSLDFIIQLKTKDNFIKSAGDYTTVNGYRSWFSLGGIKLPTLLPTGYSYGYQDEITVNISGITALPIIKLTGESTQVIKNPKIVNVTTGEEFKINTNLYNENTYLTIDTDKGTVIDHNGNDVTSLIDTNSSFITLTNGANILRYLSDNDPYDSDILPEKTSHKIEIKYKELYAN